MCNAHFTHSNFHYNYTFPPKRNKIHTNRINEVTLTYSSHETNKKILSPISTTIVSVVFTYSLSRKRIYIHKMPQLSFIVSFPLRKYLLARKKEKISKNTKTDLVFTFIHTDTCQLDISARLHIIL